MRRTQSRKPWRPKFFAASRICFASVGVRYSRDLTSSFFGLVGGKFRRRRFDFAENGVRDVFFFNEGTPVSDMFLDCTRLKKALLGSIN